jgi:predicted nuclease of predicted toxin-antitoxin system
VRFKLDENFGTRSLRAFGASGHDVVTVEAEHLSGCSDQKLYEVCIREGRCLVSLDLDFSDVIRFPPRATAGVVVIRLPRNPTLAVIERTIREFLSALGDVSLNQQLWIVEPGRIRIHQDESRLDQQ